MNNKYEKGFTLVETLLVVVIVLLLGFGGYYVYSQNKNDSDGDSTASSDSVAVNDTDSQASIVEYKQSEFTSSKGDIFTLTHPSNWKVESRDGPLDWNDPSTWPMLKITSDKGNSIKFEEGGGLGGMCEPDDKSYTLVYRLNTQNPNIKISEYSYDGSGGGITDQLVIEEWGEYTKPAHKALAVGDSSTNTCNTYILPSLRGVIYDIESSNSSGENGTVSYKDIEDDLEFVQMLESLNITP